MTNKNQQSNHDGQGIDETLPHQINAPSFKGTGISMQPPFTNSHGVVIGDSSYSSENSPLENWSEETDPETMAGDEWIHPTNDIGWNTAENRDLLEKMKKPNAYPFMHPQIDVSKGQD
ncbi:DUF3905 domain-containing protein [Mesobacillus zeae]|uniref:DUF3905 domain-containing protein n=1 Tax=Mesobacillus zeae TaxID=1917180 RepID=A0A398BJ36_9BACI|nr:DUF3905 domain-containing protein [Mesobacillus zeae]RID87790.1 DUF3905 domain-containing protein [Mesobacillus zeae]